MMRQTEKVYHKTKSNWSNISESEMPNSPASAKAFSKPKTNGADNFGLPTAVPFSTDSSNRKASSNLRALPKPFIEFK